MKVYKTQIFSDLYFFFEMTSETGAFKWEEAYTEGINIRTALQEDDSGSVEDAIKRLVMEEKMQRRKGERPSKVRLGMMRNVFIGLDLSAAIISKDLQPTRLRRIQESLINFINKFFELNPLSTMGIINGKEKRSERICGFTSNIQYLKDALMDMGESTCTGEFSLYSILETVLNSFQNLPTHSCKECILIISSLSTIDGANLRQIFEQLKIQNVHCSVISFSAEVFAFKKLCQTTQGKYSVALDKEHLDLLLSEHITPPPIKKRQGQQDSIVRMGFPKRQTMKTPSFCTCHELLGETNQFNTTDDGFAVRGFLCPQCNAHVCDTPVICRICGLLLLTAPQLARAHQHLEPLASFTENNPTEESMSICFACDTPLLPTVNKAYKCKKCEAEFCIDCDILLHESLQVCPSCG